MEQGQVIPGHLSRAPDGDWVEWATVTLSYTGFSESPSLCSSMDQHKTCSELLHATLAADPRSWG